jgi:hypothetical protein
VAQRPWALSALRRRSRLVVLALGERRIDVEVFDLLDQVL